MTARIPTGTLKALRARSLGVCEARLTGCEWYATEVHHVKSRARRGSNRLINLLHLCHTCHMLITNNVPGTDRFRTWSWQEEGQRESDAVNLNYVYEQDIKKAADKIERILNQKED